MPDPTVRAAMARATTALPGAEERPSQMAMADAVAAAITGRRHLVVQAGTGTGKSLAYLVPALTLGVRAVVATATKALQDQLARKDLPFLAEALGLPIEFAVLKGRSNYVCLQRVNELRHGDEAPGELELDISPRRGSLGREVLRIADWAEGPGGSGDRAELPWEPSELAWSTLSVGPRDCPGASRCPKGEACYAEAARKRALEADLVVVNTHLYATALVSGGEILPPHDLVVFDEAHELEDVTSSALGFELSAGRLASLAKNSRPLLDDPASAISVENAARDLEEAFSAKTGSLLTYPLEDRCSEALNRARSSVEQLVAAVRQAGRLDGSEVKRPLLQGDPGSRARHLRCLQAGARLLEDLDRLSTPPVGEVAWVEGPDRARPTLRMAPLDVGRALSERLWSDPEGPVAVLTSATVPPGLPARVGLGPGCFDQIDVGSPYDYQSQALLYCPLHLPDPRAPEYEKAMQRELAALIRAAKGRTLALFTSWRAMAAAAEALAPELPWPILTQSDLPKPALIERFSSQTHSCLFATMGFWQGVDVPGESLSLVTIDRLPFPRPDDPLLVARRRAAGPKAFELIDLPRAATLLAQGAGRLIRSREDRGVVAVLDRRLAKAPYRWELVRALPPMRRTRHLSDVSDFLATQGGGRLD